MLGSLRGQSRIAKSLVLMLARTGAKVLVIDRTTFPSDTMSGHCLHAAGVACLRRLGLFDGLAATGAPAQEAITVDFGLEGLSGARPLDAALADYGRPRDAAAGPMYALTSDLALLAPPTPEMAGLVAALSGDPEETGRFLGIMSGTVAVADFFAPDNLAWITGTAEAA